jgi:hypothetical protein
MSHIGEVICSRHSHKIIIDYIKDIDQILTAYYMEIIADSSYALRNMEIYSRGDLLTSDKYNISTK